MNAASRVQPFGFDRDFSVIEGVRMTDPEDVARRISGLEAELAQIRTEIGHREELARQEGFEAGLEQARSEQQQAILHALDAINACLENAGDALARERRRTIADAAGVALAAADHLYALAIERDAAAPVERVINQILDEISPPASLTIRVAPELAAPLEERVAAVQHPDGLRAVIIGDASLVCGDVRVEWPDGSLSLDVAQRRSAVEAALKEALC